MGMYKHIRDLKKNHPEKYEALQKQRLKQWRQEPATKRVEQPTDLHKARSVGYKAKDGVIVVRQRVARGGRKRKKFKAGRTPRKRRRKKIVNKNYQQVAEEKAARVYDNCEVLNSYKVLEDGKHAWFEVILVDRFHPQVLNDDQLKQATKRKGKAFRGVTQAGRKSRGLRQKGTGTEKSRPGKKSSYRKKQ